MHPEPGAPLKTDRIREHLRELLASGAFAGSPKLSRFLEFTVEQTLAGNRDVLKEYLLGVEIYGRPPNYDPRTDPIIRVEARRLRARLKQYYETGPVPPPVQIEYPKGSYVPEFRWHDQTRREPTRPVRPARRRLAAFLAAAAALAALVAILTLAVHRTQRPDEPLFTKVTADLGLSAWPALSANGEMVAYASDRDSPGELHIWVQRIERGDPVRLTHEPATNTEPAFSADGRLVAYRSERATAEGIFAVPADGGPERLLIAYGRRPRYSPDGKWLAYWIARTESASGRDELYVLPLAGGGPRRIAASFTSATLPNWSSDGKRLLFRGTSDSPETLNWWVVDVEGGRPVPTNAIEVLLARHMVQALPWDYRPYAWMDDRVLFSARLGEVTNIWQLHVSPATLKATGAAERLTSGITFDAYPTMIRPAGAQPILAFADTIASINVWSLPVEPDAGIVTGEPQPVTNEVATWICRPSAAASGTRLVHTFLRSKEKAFIYVRDLQTGSLSRIYPNPETIGWPTLSPDGSRVAYRNEQGSSEPVYVAAADAREPEIHASMLCADCGRPMDWSRDNTRLLYGTRRTPHSISVLDTRTGQKTELFSDPTFDLEAARFSPSGDWIAFCTRDQSGTGKTFVARFDPATNQGSRPWIAVTDDTARDLLPAWSPDGNLLYLFSERDHFRCLWAQRLNPASKQPLGPPFPVRHFHQLRHSLLRTIHSPPEAVGLCVTRDRLFFSTDDMTGNVWIAKWQ